MRAFLCVCIAVIAAGCGSEPNRVAPPNAPAPTTSPKPVDEILLGGVEEMTLMIALEDPGSAFDRAVVIDEIGRRRLRKAIPLLITYLDDGRALEGSDNWVGGHACKALRAITGQDLPCARGAWQAWWNRQPHGGK